MAEFVAMILKTAIKSVIFLFILFLFMEMGLLAFGAMITHSHCPNHSRNNTENMHTHDTTDADHNEKHKAGHPHTWEFDEHCPPGTERDTSKKSSGGDFPSKPVLPIQPDGDGDEDADDTFRGSDAPYVPGKCPTLTGYSIEVNDKEQIRLVGKSAPAYLSLFFDDSEMTIYGVLIGWEHPKSLSLGDFGEWLDMADLEIVAYQGTGICRFCDNLFVSDAKRIVFRVLVGSLLCYVAEYPEPVPSAPSIGKRKLATTWASLKMR